jgi:hypothetical protein
MSLKLRGQIMLPVERWFWECVALQHQLAILERLGTRRPRFRPIDRLFWVFMSWCGRPGATHSWCVW